MYKVILAVAMSMFAASAFAHHAAEDVVDDATYDMIDENLEDADSPHIDMDLVM